MFGGGFGTNNTTQAPGAFGGGGGFGAGGGGFAGATGGGFGTGSSLFGGGGATAAPATPGFGLSTSTTGFGAATGGGFGAGAGGSGFGAARSGFGGGTTGGGVFGAPSTSTAGAFGGGGFGAGNNSGFKPPGTGMLGGTGGGFGQQSAMQQQGGMFGATPGVGGGMINMNNMGTGRFQAVTESEQGGQGRTVTMHYQSISAMPDYQAFSFEELRLRDYELGKKYGNNFGGGGGAFNTMGGNSMGTTGFGASQPGGFGGLSVNTRPGGGLGAGGSVFGGGSTFGTAPATTFGGGGLGATTQPGGIFGASTVGGGMFGGGATTTAPAFRTGTGMFGSSTAAPAFGAGMQGTQPKFGATPAGGGFGTGGGFGATGGTGVFGKTATTQAPAFGGGGGFGTTQAPAFGGGGTGMFGGGGTTQAGTGMFGGGLGGASGFGVNKQATTPGFGGLGTGQQGGMFGQQTPAAGGLGATTVGTGFGAGGAAGVPLFGGGQAGGGTGFGGLGGGLGGGFGGGASGGSMFGGQNKQGFSSFGGNQGGSSFGGGLGQSAFGTGTGLASGSFGGGLVGSQSFGLGGGLGQQQQPVLQARVDQNPYGNNPLFQNLQKNSTSIPQEPSVVQTPAAAKKPSLTPQYKVTPRSAAKMKLRGFSSPNPQPVDSPGRQAGGSSHVLDGSSRDDAVLGVDPRFLPRKSLKKLDFSETANDGFDHLNGYGGSSPGREAPSAKGKESARRPQFDPKLEDIVNSRRRSAPVDLTVEDVNLSFRSTSTVSPAQNGKSRNPRSATSSPTAKARPSDYIMTPPLEQLLRMNDHELSQLPDFEVSLEGVGRVRFLDPVDLISASPTKDANGIHLIPGKLIVIEPKVVVVYPDEEGKPPVGMGLNVRAEIELDGCWAIDKATRKAIMDETDPRYDRHIRKLESMPETYFRGFHKPTGRWKFRVEHFSRYGLDDEEDEDERGGATRHAGAAAPQRGVGGTPVGSRNNTPKTVQFRESVEFYKEDDSEYSEEGSSLIDDSVLRVRSKTNSEVQQTVQTLRGPLNDLRKSVLVKQMGAAAAAARDVGSPGATRGRKRSDRVGSTKRILDEESDDDSNYSEYEEEEIIVEEIEDDEEEGEGEIWEEDEVEVSQTSPGRGEKRAIVDDDLEMTQADELEESADVRNLSINTGSVDGDRESIKSPPVAVIAGSMSYERMGLARKTQVMRQSLFNDVPSPRINRNATQQIGAAPLVVLATKKVEADSPKLAVSSLRRAETPIRRSPKRGFGISENEDGEAMEDEDDRETVRTLTSEGMSIDEEWIKSRARSSVEPDYDVLAPIVQKVLPKHPPLSKSIVYEKQKNAGVDAGYFFARSFRVGWADGGVYASLSRSSPSHITIRRLPIFGLSDGESTESERLRHQVLLRTILDHSTITPVGIETFSASSIETENGVQKPSCLNERYAPVAELAKGLTFDVCLTAAMNQNTNRGSQQDSSAQESAAKTIFGSQEMLAWKLAHALWDDLYPPGPPGALSPEQMKLLLEAMRKEEISRWLKESVQDSVEAELRELTASVQSKDVLGDFLFTYLSGRQIGKAVTEAIRGKDYRLATILAQVGGAGSLVGVRRQADRFDSAQGTAAVVFSHGVPGRGGTDDGTRSDVEQQIEIWEKISKGAKVSESHMNVWKLISGTSWTAPMFARLSKDWRRTWGIFFWYASGGWLTPANSIQEYEETFKISLEKRKELEKLKEEQASGLEEQNLGSSSWSGGFPLSARKAGQEASGRISAIANKIATMQKELLPIPEPLAAHVISESESEVYYDLCFHLLKLFVDEGYPLENAMHPCTITPNLCDYRVQWIFWLLISRVKKSREFSDARRTGSKMLVDGESNDRGVPELWSAQANRLCLSFIFQLEALGMWEWAVFVAMYLKRPREVPGHGVQVTGEAAAATIQGLLSRWFPLEDMSGSCWYEAVGLEQSVNSERWTFLVDTLKVPPIWIHEARALRAGYVGDYIVEAVALIDAQRYSTAHQIIIAKIIPNSVIENCLGLPQNLLKLIPSQRVAGWDHGGGMYLEYFSLVEEVPTLVEKLGSETSSNGNQAMEVEGSVKEQLRERFTRLMDLLGLLSETNVGDMSNVKAFAALAEMSRKVLMMIEECERIFDSDVSFQLGSDIFGVLIKFQAPVKRIDRLKVSEDARIQRLIRVSYKMCSTNDWN
ncbi:hypothetical protein BJ742DRAFT_851518 [Cladochytrium replicatum]|nr:hypothetical protein BJ742DRAFT_851518 [Cladochytrium replicatum]